MRIIRLTLKSWNLGDRVKIVIDTNVLVQIMQNENAKDLADPETGAVIEDGFRRAEALVERVETLKTVAVIPAPVLAEYLIGLEPGTYQEHLDIINGSAFIEVVSFDQASAIECAYLVNDQERKMMDPDAKQAKLKFDRQILAIAIAVGAKELWTHDKTLYRRAANSPVTPRSLADIGPQPEQMDFHADIQPNE